MMPKVSWTKGQGNIYLDNLSLAIRKFSTEQSTTMSQGGGPEEQPEDEQGRREREAELERLAILHGEKMMMTVNKKLCKNWLIIMKNPKSVINYTWQRLLENLNMQTIALATYIDEANGKCEHGAFCIFKTPRTISKMYEKLGEFCHIHRLENQFALTDEKFNSLLCRNLLQVEGTIQVNVPCLSF